MADLAQFQAQANAIYDPQGAAEKASLKTGYDATYSQLESSKADVGTNYERAIRGVNETEKGQVSSLNALYSSRLAGNFSGLQGNALQGLYGKDNQARADLATNRINKLAQITGQETSALNKYNTDSRGVDAKITSEKAKYSSENYNSAVREEQRVAMEQEKERAAAERENAKMAQAEAFHSDQMNMEYAKINSSRSGGGSRGGGSSSGSRADSKMADMANIATTLQNKAGKDGHVSQQTWNAAMAAWTGAGYSANDFSKNNLQFVNQRYKGYHGYN